MKFGSYLSADDSPYYPTGDNQHPIAEKTWPAPGSEKGQHSVDPAGGEAARFLTGRLRFGRPGGSCIIWHFLSHLRLLFSCYLELDSYHFRTSNTFVKGLRALVLPLLKCPEETLFG